MARHRKVLESGEAASAPRIVGGTLRGRTLEFAPAARTRPMKDRVRETLFDLLGPWEKGEVAIDLFAGTGALGFEAVSRGATEAVLCERHFPTADALRHSARQLGIERQTDVRPGDVLLWAKKMPPLPLVAPWLVFVSPPWSFFSERSAELMALIEAMRAAAPSGSRFVVESDDSFDPAPLPGTGWEARPIPPAVLHVVF
ncbi:MAG: RsmD family RNA methyltransferase [Planctomycetota bacterium]|nr:RsmD family RNA methyltransferase [Planctomycetota bacterium]